MMSKHRPVSIRFWHFQMHTLRRLNVTWRLYRKKKQQQQLLALQDIFSFSLQILFVVSDELYDSSSVTKVYSMTQ